VEDEKIVLKSSNQKSSVYFCSPHVVGVFGSDDVKKDVEPFITLDIDDIFIDAYVKIKKIGPVSKFNNVYFNVENNKFTVESCDRSNRYSNSLKMDLITKISKKKSDAPKNLSMCFDFKNFVNLMTVINGDVDEFKINFTYIDDQELGVMYAVKNDNSEKYILMSSSDTMEN
jgi:hypothetical protein